MNFTLTQEQYEALIALARRGVKDDTAGLVALEGFLRSVEKSNGIARDFVLVQWKELNKPMPALDSTKFPDTYPPEQRKSIEFISRRVARADVEAMLSRYASEPTSVLVTRDPAGIVGWTTLDDFFRT